MAPVEREGFLQKKSYLTYRPRYFVLQGSNLCYKATKEETEARGLMTLTTDSQVIEFPAKRAFQLTTGNKSWLVKAEEDMDLQAWISALRTAIMRLQHDASSPESHSEGERFVHHEIGGRDFVLDSRYTDLKQLGSGAYGMVVSALDTRIGKRCAIKKCAGLFADPLDAKKIAREIRIMSQLDSPFIVKVVDVLIPPGPDFDDVYMVGELMDVDLHRAIYYGKPLSNDHVQFFMYQLLCGLKYMASVGIVHRDLKPSNILVNSNCDLKLTDFGLARCMDEGTRDLTEYVVTRWYRAPEVMLSSCKYTAAIDVWSAGCIMGEMLMRKPLFPGDNYRGVLRLITKVTGAVTEADLWFVTNPNAKAYMTQKLPPYKKADLQTLMPTALPATVDLLGRMLEFDFAKRIDIDAALAHPYFEDVREPEWEKVASPEKFHWGEIETVEPTRLNMQRLIMEDAMRLNPVHAPVLAEIQRRLQQQQSISRAA